MEKTEKDKKSLVSQLGEGVEAVGRRLQEWRDQKSTKQQQEYQEKARAEMEERARAKGKGKGKGKGPEEDEMRYRRSVFLGNSSGDESLSWLTSRDEEGWQRKRKYEQELMVTLEKQLGKIRKLTVKFGKRTGMLELEGEQDDAEERVERAPRKQPRISDPEGNRIFLQRMKQKEFTGKGERKGKGFEKGKSKGRGKRKHREEDDMDETEMLEIRIQEQRKESRKQRHERLKTDVKTAGMRKAAADFLMKHKEKPTQADYDRFERLEFNRHEEYQREEQEIEVVDLGKKDEKSERRNRGGDAVEDRRRSFQGIQ